MKTTVSEKKVACHTFGCRLNQYETEKMAASLRPFGFVRTSDNKNETADLYLINTCTVTHRADRDCRSYIRRIVRQNPKARIVVAGCFVDYDPETVKAIEGVDVVIRNSEKESLSDILRAKLPELFEVEPDKNCSTLISDFFERNRAWLKISDGCNQWCSFCIIPTVRGRLQHKPVRDIIEEINNLVDSGYKEVVLTGVNIGYYKDEERRFAARNLAALCRHILKQTKLHRLRLSSIESQTLGPDLVELYREYGGRICRHWHLPLQSGSSRILKLMQRPYNREAYIQRAEQIKAVQPNTIIGADVIVGFPGETDDDYSQTRKLAESGLLDYLHVFSYSDRAGTKATAIKEKVETKVIRNRNIELTEISKRIKHNSLKRQIGQVLEVIPQHKSNGNGRLWGITDNFLKTKLPADTSRNKSILNLKVTSSSSDYIEGTILSHN
ncbi:MAG: tRNA (N(6)-L-threonylcarbamoyladenosine(37)-C(2))-methylthiotransferase MtaB [candidate division Zixibacteria bacterium]|nr:tRNA (N(6)-L-threonylcarbamoyladenosine(37)-C(2))-methylthiotransferase MtaB [candidate division Zixibacteria bacterium]